MSKKKKEKINVAVLNEAYKVFVHSETPYGYLVSKEEKPIKLFHITSSQVTP
tara:strand:- start:47 stop:202 length:156 start_codon:yes stop_codon:yes gene_type:complete